MQNVASTISQNHRRPWQDEPSCGNSACHGSNYAEEPGKLFRNSKGHGGLFCSACHGSPHAIQPTREANDNLQNLTYQGHVGALSDCMVCHSSAPPGPGPHGLIYTGVKQINSEIPTSFKMYQNYPNPFNPTTRIKIDIANNQFVTLKVYDMNGKEISSLLNKELQPGTYEVKWDAAQYSSGIYFVKMQSGNFVSTKKVTLIK
jgi:hypothetical protein